MTKGDKQYTTLDNNGKWFAHAGLPVNDTKREACTSTGSMLSVRKTIPLGVTTERYPKHFLTTEQKNTGRIYPFSVHDNRSALQNTINAFDDGLGRKKCLDDRRQQNSHFCLCHHGGVNDFGVTRGDFSAYQTDYRVNQDTESTTGRRFPRNHLERSTAAAVAQKREHFMWFGRHDLNHPLPLGVLAATNCSNLSGPNIEHCKFSKHPTH